MMPIGVTWKDHQKLCKPVFQSGIQSDLVWFAGEHCSDIFDGYIHGALLNGNETATMLRNCLANRSNCPSNAVSLIWFSCFAVGIIIAIIVITWLTWMHGKTFVQKFWQQLVLDSRNRYTKFFSSNLQYAGPVNVDEVIDNFTALYRRFSTQFVIGAFLFCADSMIMLSFELSIDKKIGHYGEQKRIFSYNPSSVLLLM